MEWCIKFLISSKFPLIQLGNGWKQDLGAQFLMECHKQLSLWASSTLFWRENSNLSWAPELLLLWMSAQCAKNCKENWITAVALTTLKILSVEAGVEAFFFICVSFSNQRFLLNFAFFTHVNASQKAILDNLVKTASLKLWTDHRKVF